MTYLSAYLADMPPATMQTFAPTVKNFVASEIRKIDTTVSVFSTEYFDHAFAPDLVMRWDGQRRERFVFLRTGDPARFLDEDHRLLDDTKPLVVAMDEGDEDPTRNGERSSESLEQQLRARGQELDTLLMGIDATVDMTEEAEADHSVRLLAQGLLQGGRGFADRQFIHQTAEGVRAGFSGAEVGDVDATGSLIDTLTVSLAGTEASRMTRVLRAIWDGNGQDSSRFPGSDSLGPLGDEDLRYLILSLEAADERFWRRVANGVDIEQLVRVGSSSELELVPSFQALVRSRAEHLRGKAVRALATFPTLEGPNGNTPRWAVQSNVLTLRASHADFLVAARSTRELPALIEDKSLESKALRDDRLPTFDKYVARRHRLSDRISMVELDQGSGNRVIFDSREPGKEFDDSAILPNITASSRVRRVATKCDGTDVEADFKSDILATRTSGRASIVAMIDVASVLLVDTPEESREMLRAFLRVEPDLTFDVEVLIFDEDSTPGNATN